MKMGSTHGSALTELALICPIFLVFLAGVMNYGFALRTATALASAARAGAQYGAGSTADANDTVGIRSVAVNSAPGVAAMTVSSVVSCQCPGGTAVSCGGSCGNGNMLMYLQVTASAAATSFISYAGLPPPGTVTAQATIRVQ